jgi:hypothetical protein
VDVELFEDVLDMLPNGVRRDEEQFCDLAVLLATGDPAENLRLPRGQPQATVGTPTEIGVDLDSYEMRTEQRQERDVAFRVVLAAVLHACEPYSRNTPARDAAMAGPSSPTTSTSSTTRNSRAKSASS